MNISRWIPIGMRLGREIWQWLSIWHMTYSVDEWWVSEDFFYTRILPHSLSHRLQTIPDGLTVRCRHIDMLIDMVDDWRCPFGWSFGLADWVSFLYHTYVVLPTTSYLLDIFPTKKGNRRFTMTIHYEYQRFDLWIKISDNRTIKPRSTISSVSLAGSQTVRNTGWTTMRRNTDTTQIL